jgi:hypothetical protein
MDVGWEMPKRQLHKEQDLVAYRQKLVPAAQNRALRACSAFEGDVLIIESELDHVIPHAVISSYMEACAHARSLTYRVIKGADHGLAAEPCQRAYTTLLVGWLSEMVVGAREGNLSPQAPATPEVELPESELPEAPPSPA